MLRQAAASLMLAAGLMTGASQAQMKPDTPPRFAGGFAAGACSFPKSARSAGLSGCCEMTLDIDAEGHVVKSRGRCTDEVFLQPTRRCLTVQQFIPATRGGLPVAATHVMKYEWRADGGRSQCKKLQVS